MITIDYVIVAKDKGTRDEIKIGKVSISESSMEKISSKKFEVIKYFESINNNYYFDLSPKIFD